MDRVKISLRSTDLLKKYHFAIGPLSNIVGDAPLDGFFEATFASISIFPEKFESKNVLGTHTFELRNPCRQSDRVANEKWFFPPWWIARPARFGRKRRGQSSPAASSASETPYQLPANFVPVDSDPKSSKVTEAVSKPFAASKKSQGNAGAFQGKLRGTSQGPGQGYGPNSFFKFLCEIKSL
jgi:hypothetical protein